MQDKQDMTKRKKICYVITKGNWGGAQKYVYNLATSLPHDLYDVLVVTGESGILNEKLQVEGIKTISISSLKRDVSIIKEFSSFFSLFKIIKSEKPDILHLNSPKASGLGALAGRLLGVKKIITTVHGFTWNEDRDPLSKLMIIIFTWITILLCHKTIVIAPREEKQAHKLPLIGENKIVLIKNGIEKIPFVQKEDARRKLLADIGKKDAGEVLWIGTVSELHQNKGLEYAITAVSKINKPFIFFIIGEGEEKENLQRIILKHHLEQRVFITGFIDKANLYLKAFDIFLLTSIKEGLPYVILEAGEASLPVVATSVGGIPDIIETNKNGILVETGRPGDITRALHHLINNLDKQKIFGQKLKQRIDREFGIEKMLEKTIKLY